MVGSKIPLFFVYQDYAAAFGFWSQKLTSSSKSIVAWEAYERGIEGLMNAFEPRLHDSRDDKRGLTLEDLLIKVRQPSFIASTSASNLTSKVAYSEDLQVPFALFSAFEDILVHR